MEFKKLIAYLKNKQNSSSREIKKWNCTRFLVGDKPYAILSKSEDENIILTLKFKDSMVEKVIKDFPKIILPSARYETRHWNDINLGLTEGKLSDEKLCDFIDKSYLQIVETLPILEQAICKNQLEYFEYNMEKLPPISIVDLHNNKINDILKTSAINMMNNKNGSGKYRPGSGVGKMIKNSASSKEGLASVFELLSKKAITMRKSSTKLDNNKKDDDEID